MSAIEFINCPACNQPTKTDRPYCSRAKCETPFPEEILQKYEIPSTEEYAERIAAERIADAVTQGMMEETLEERKSKNSEIEDSYLNPWVILGVILCALCFFSGDILNFLGWGTVLQQTAMSIASGFLGLGCIIIGIGKAICDRLDKIIHNGLH